MHLYIYIYIYIMHAAPGRRAAGRHLAKPGVAHVLRAEKRASMSCNWNE